ncbi:MAG: LuxR C-terminal-related transcriptional regulator [Rhizobiaceae bacterium]
MAMRESGAARPGETDRKNPFGAPPPLAPHHTITMADASRRGRWIAVDINADEFSLFFVASSIEGSRLVACVDSAHPALALRTRTLSSQMGELVARLASASTAPCWWSEDPDCASSSAFAGLTLAAAAPVRPLGQTGIAFPVYADRGQSGVVIFSGPDIVMDDRLMCETHGRCFALFAAVTALRPMESGMMPAISKRELECLKLTANGMTSEEIAQALGLSVHTANQYLSNSAQKLNAVNRMHAVAKALRLGLID